jgi:pyruvate kinase
VTSRPPQLRRTKIVCTIGPVSSSSEQLAQLMDAGMNVARLNTSHGTIEDHVATTARIRDVARMEGKTIGVLADLAGPKPRTKAMGGVAIQLETGAEVRLATEECPACELVIDYPDLLGDIQAGERVLIDDGNLALTVVGLRDEHLICHVEQGGIVLPRKGVNFPDSRLSTRAITQRDEAAIEAGVAAGVDFFGLSFVSSAEDVRHARELIKMAGGDTPIIAKIERKLAVEHLDEIVAEADGVMVARGDLGVELPPEEVPVWQRRIIAAASRARKPVITATQMLESMIHSPRPTRAETSDVANAVWDESDAVMLSAETATGRFPVEAVRMMDRIVRRAEAESPAGLRAHSHLIALAVRHVVEADSNVRAVVCFTNSGYTAQLISKVHVDLPIYGLTPNALVARRLTLARSVVPIETPLVYSADEMLRMVDRVMMSTGLLHDGEEVVVVASLPLAHQGRTNFIKLHHVGESMRP